MGTLQSARILVTGGTGFIGSHLVGRLVRDGANVHLLVRLESSLWRLEGLANSITLWKGDLTNLSSVRRCLKASRPQIVFHLAAATSVRGPDPLLSRTARSVDVNLRGTLNILEALQEERLSLKCFVQTGGLEEYGNGPAPYDEGQREGPVSAYSASQVAATHYCQMLHRNLGLPIALLRPALIYGPAQSNDMFIPSLIEHCLKGQDFQMTSGDQGRDLIYVSDVIEAYVRASLSPVALGEVINVGSGREYRISDVAEKIVAITRSSIQLKKDSLPKERSEIQHLVCRNEKAKRLLEWFPRIDLEEGLKKTVEWYKNNHQCDRRSR